MAARKYMDKLIDINDIDEEIVKINGSETDYISKNGHVYKRVDDNKFIKKSSFINKHNGYLYASITYRNGQRQRRVHILVATAYIPNPDKLPYVMHIDNNKENACVDNLKWGTASENTKQAYKDGLIKNKRGFEDSQSMHVNVYDKNFNFLKTFGSIAECAKEIGITKSAIIYQCKNKTSKSTKCGYYFRFA